MRKWTRKNGKEFTAEFVKREGPVVTLKKPDGSEITVKMPGLSDEDRKYVEQLTKSQGKPETNDQSDRVRGDQACHSRDGRDAEVDAARRTARWSLQPSSSSVRGQW